MFSSWQLLGAGSVGSQSLTGIPVLHRLRGPSGTRTHGWRSGRSRPACGSRDSPIGLTRCVFAEVWPGWVPLDPDRHPVRDAAQVLGLAAALAELDAGGCLASHFSPTVATAGP